MKNTEIFSVDEAMLRHIVSKALCDGGDWCDLYFEDSSYFDLLLRDGEVSSGGHHIDYGCGIRVLKGEKTGYAYAESTDINALTDAAAAAAAIASSGNGRLLDFGRQTPSRKAPAEGFYPSMLEWSDCPVSQFVPFLKKIDSEIRRREPRTCKVIAVLSYCISNILMYNSLGELTSDRRPIGSISVQAIFTRNGESCTNNVSRSLRCGAEMICDDVLEDLVGRAISGLDAQFDARRPKGGKMPVVMGAGASGILLHEAMGHAFEADFIRKGQSVFTGRLGQRVCPKGINIVDDGTIAKNRGACNFDDEGVPGQKTYMVTDGILTSFLHDRISAAYFGVEPTGNGRRESFRYNPIPRMRATYMESGSDGSLEDLVASVRKGIYVDQFSNGQVKIGEGDFTFYVKSGRLIENGRLTSPVKDINIIGNGPEALADIRGVASDLRIDESTWTCGKEQSVPVSCGIPSILVGSLTVGGE